MLAGIFVPPRIQEEIGEGFVEPMAYPVIDAPMYEPLKNLSSELFLPNINLIEPNSVTLLETNQPFIESYMVGLNHEFARELLWREYPTDQRGSTFRQFWDVRSFYAPDADAEALREKLRDIRPLHRWTRESALGDHDNREEGTAKEDELVLVIRGELLKRYPTAVIYAHRACWQRTDDGTAADRAKDPCSRSGAIDNSKERRLAPLTAEEQGAPPRSKVLTPLFEARIDPDIYFLGFDLTAENARGGSGEHPDDDPGWFFVIKERPGEPRFGLDAEAQTADECLERSLVGSRPTRSGRQPYRNRVGASGVSAGHPRNRRRREDHAASGRPAGRVEPGHELRRARVHPVSGARARRRARERDAAEVRRPHGRVR